MNKEEIKKNIRLGYAEVAKGVGSCCGPKVGGCCDMENSVKAISKGVGYTDRDINSVPEGANLGLGCGNPVALATIREGDVVLDLGSGAGFDCFLAADRVGKGGKVIGVDMTPEMLEKARENARKNGYDNVEFRLGEIENLPVADNSVDLIISNCVINLSPEKDKVFNEAYRTLKPGGRLMVSDIVLLEDLPKAVQESVAAYIGCLAGASLKKKYLAAISASGFKEIEIVDEASFESDFLVNDPTVKVILSMSDLDRITKAARSVKVSAIKPTSADK